MAFEFQPDEPVAKGVQRIARNQIAKALDGLIGRGDANSDEVIHDARKRLKKVRALVRLARSGLGPKLADREDDRLRDAARPLSEVRDASVLVDTLDGLVERFGDEGEPEAIASAREALVSRKREITRRVLDEGNALAKVAQAMEQVRRDAKRWEVDGDDWDVLEAGLDRIYQRGLRAFREATARPTDENLHEWRKRVKDLWYVMDILKPIRPEYTGRLGTEAHKLADLLGDDHDLSVLRETLPDSGEILLTLIAGRRVELQREAFALGPILHAEEPKLFLARLGAYWRAWRSEAKAARFDPP
jgi:CHAD domain-containing protein